MSINTTQELRSLITADGELHLSIDDVPLAEPGPDEVVIEIHAAPLNPSDVGEILGLADISTLETSGPAQRPATTAKIPPQFAARLARRAGTSVPVGNEGAGVVIAAGENAQHLIGKVAGALAGGMYARHRKLNANQVVVFPEGVTPKQAAAAFVNPLTALGMLSTMRLEGHTALVHTAAASNLGQMLNRLCQADDVELVNIVRSEPQEQILKSLGAKHIVNSTAPDFRQRLTDAVHATGATLAFDAVGGGPLAGQILVAMEDALVKKAPAPDQYGTRTHKQVYIYGRLDLAPTPVPASVGMAWGVGGWVLFSHLERIGRKAGDKLRERIANEIATTFASNYTREVSLAEALDPDIIKAYQRAATGEKYLLIPSE